VSVSQSASSFSRRLYLATLLAFVSFLTTACGNLEGSEDGASKATAPAAYCPTSSQNTYSGVSRVRIQGKAFYEYRVNGNGFLANGAHPIAVTSIINGDAYSIRINGTTIGASCDSTCTRQEALTAIMQAINNNTTVNPTVVASITNTTVGSAATFAYYNSMLLISPKTPGVAMTVDNLSASLTDSYRTSTSSSTTIPMTAEPKPIRYAEVRVYQAGSSSPVQCAQTDAAGAFDFYLPRSTGNYTIEVASRADNSMNTAYIMKTPSTNAYYGISKTIASTADDSSTALFARASGSYEGGAFFILDQILKSQEYLRAQTLNCGTNATTNFFSGCVPFTVAPVVMTYWSPGVSPGVYIGSNGPISYYMNGQRQLYIGGGLNGDTNSSDMDQFDPSVIVHEYGHFIEDQYGKPDSPGGSHNGNSIIDPRLAWGEGWADFFQAAVLYGTTGGAVYRDTYGNIGCTGSACVGINFNVDLTTQTMDIPSTTGEGIFREFSITRLLYNVVKPSGTSKFSEIWTAIVDPTKGMKVVNDPFKSMARFHKIRSSITGATDWSSIATAEKQYTNSLLEYGTPVTVNGSCSRTTMDIKVSGSDNGSFSTSDLFNSNDFYRYDHPGGALNLSVNWTGSDNADLDIYVYKSGYYYGEGYVAAGTAEVRGTAGSDSVSKALAAGTYLINVMAFTGTSSNGTPMYSSNGTYTTNYNLYINSQLACPNP
jgi:hypothetical protein